MEEKEYEIDLRELFGIIKKRIGLIILFAVVYGVNSTKILRVSTFRRSSAIACFASSDAINV